MKMSVVTSLHVFFISFIIHSVQLQLLKENVLRLTRFLGHCEGKEHLPVRFYNISVRNLGRKVVVNSKIIIEHDVTNDISPILTLQRCSNKDALDTCETYQNMRFPKSCDLINAKKQFWSPFVDSVHPRMECPFRKGTHVVKNATFDAGNILFPVTGWYWKSTLNTYDVVTKENLMCIYLEGEIVNKGRRRN